MDFSKIQRVLDFSPEHTTESNIQQVVKMVRDGEFSDAEDRPDYYGNYQIPKFESAP